MKRNNKQIENEMDIEGNSLRPSWHYDYLSVHNICFYRVKKLITKKMFVC